MQAAITSTPGGGPYRRQLVRFSTVMSRVHGNRQEPIGVRLRGRLGSFQRFEDKPKFNLDLNEYSDQRPFGLERLALSSGGMDPSKLKEVLGAQLMALADVPASRAGFAQLFINGEDYGLYITIEAQDDRWMRRSIIKKSRAFLAAVSPP